MCCWMKLPGAFRKFQDAFSHLVQRWCSQGANFPDLKTTYFYVFYFMILFYFKNLIIIFILVF